MATNINLDILKLAQGEKEAKTTKDKNLLGEDGELNVTFKKEFSLNSDEGLENNFENNNDQEIIDVKSKQELDINPSEDNKYNTETEKNDINLINANQISDVKSLKAVNLSKEQDTDIANAYKTNKKIVTLQTSKIKLNDSKNIETEKNLNVTNKTDLSEKVSNNINNLFKKETKGFSENFSTNPIIEKKEKTKKIKTFFNNFLNYKKKSKKLLGSSFNKIKLDLVKINLHKSEENIDINKIKFVPEKPKVENQNKEKINYDSITKVNNSKMENLNLSSNNDNSANKNITNNELLSFDRLKNILDIRLQNSNEKLAEIIDRNIKNSNNKFEIQLKPQNLGKLEVTLEVLGDNVDIIIKSDNINAVQMLFENNSSLQKMLNNSGLSLGNFNLNGNNSNNKNTAKDKNNNNVEDANNKVDNTKDDEDTKKIINNKILNINA